MADLIQEFFQRDLTEPEHEALANFLSSSPEAVLKYEGLLEKNYLATGLPLPSIPQGLQNLPHLGGSGLAGGSMTVKILFLALVAAGATLWEFWPSPKLEMPAPLPQAVMPQVPLKAVAPSPGHRAEVLEQVRPLAVGPSQEGGELSVVVNTSQKSLVTVRILDASGNEMRALYTGFVGSGRWDFRWDGLLDNGKPAQAGDYLIDIQSGAAHQSKNIKIKIQPTNP